MRKHWVWMSILLLLVALALSPTLLAKDWVYLGNAHADGSTDHDTIRVSTNQAFHAIQLRVNGGAVDFERVVVHYGGGGKDELAVREHVGSGDKTDEIKLPGDHRTVESVEIWYAKEKLTQRPEIQLYAAR